MTEYYGIQHSVIEWAYVSGTRDEATCHEVELDVVVTDPEQQEWKVPAFWAGGQDWRVRFSPRTPGVYHYRTHCSDEQNGDLHGREGVLTVAAYQGNNPLLTHGPLRVSANRRYLEHLDGTPFFWLGDTWWMGLCQRNGWSFEDFRVLAADRVKKGFSVIQIVAGLYPDMPPFDPRGANEAGHPWEHDYTCINPAYFDRMDLRIHWLVKSGLVPCIVGCWGYFLPWMGLKKMKQHWRYLIARYGAYPVVWCLAGEGAMPYYLSAQREADSAFQKRGWTEVGRYVRSIDPYHHPVTIHPNTTARETVEESAVLDVDMLQTGHGGWGSVLNTLTLVNRAYTQAPSMPVINGEVCYEGHQQISWHDIQRFLFWTSMLSGAAGHTYGAGGIWQMNTREQPHGPSPHGGTYENTAWDVAMQLPGSHQLGLGKALLMRYPWFRFEPHPEWVEPRWSPQNYMLPFAAGIPGEVRVVYIPSRIYNWSGPVLQHLEDGIRYHARYVDPISGHEYALGEVVATADQTWQAPNVPLAQDWVLVLERH